MGELIHERDGIFYMYGKRVETAEGNFPYVDVGWEDHGRPSFRLWVSERLVETLNARIIVRFPARAVVRITARGTRVLKPSADHVTYVVGKSEGYRGGSSFSIESPADAQVYQFLVYASQRGSLGVARYGLVVVTPPQPVVFRWERTGRTYGGPKEGLTRIDPDGSIYEWGSLADGMAELEELRREIGGDAT